MTNPKTSPRNLPLLSTPTLLFALVFAHVTHFVCDLFEMNEFMCTVVYLFAFATPIAIKHLLKQEIKEQRPHMFR
jgi:hypothetical protein